MSSEKPLVYLILGAAGSGRREIVADLIEGGLAAGAASVRSSCSRPANRPARPTPASARSRAGRGATAASSRRTSPARRTCSFSPTAAAIRSTRSRPSRRGWRRAAANSARILCVIHCGLAAQHKELLAWYDACVHFADVVLLNRREGVANKWMSDFQARYAAQFLPCLFELVKAGRVENPALILEPQARRMSHVFDEEPNWEVTGAGGEEADGGGDRGAARGGSLPPAPGGRPAREGDPGHRQIPCLKIGGIRRAGCATLGENFPP